MTHPNAGEALKVSIQKNSITKMIIKDNDNDRINCFDDDDETPKRLEPNYWLGRSNGSFSKSCLKKLTNVEAETNGHFHFSLRMMMMMIISKI